MKPYELNLQDKILEKVAKILARADGEELISLDGVLDAWLKDWWPCECCEGTGVVCSGPKGAKMHLIQEGYYDDFCQKCDASGIDWPRVRSE